jgi:hypothetical protein
MVTYTVLSNSLFGAKKWAFNFLLLTQQKCNQELGHEFSICEGNFSQTSFRDRQISGEEGRDIYS